MKKRIVLACLLFISMISKAQYTRSPVLYFDTIPLLISTRLFISNDFAHATFVTVSKHLNITIAQRVKHLNFNTIFQSKKRSIDKHLLKNLDFCQQTSVSQPMNWKPLKDTYLLADTSLQTGDSLIFSFRNRDGIVLQRNLFIRAKTVPVIVGYKQTNVMDRIPFQLLAAEIFRRKSKLPGFTQIKESPDTTTLVLRPGLVTYLQLSSQGLNLDSCLLYRIRDISSGGPFGSWATGRHLLQIPALHASHSYFLECCYGESDQQSRFHILVANYWWQERWAEILFSTAAVLLVSASILFICRRMKIIKERRVELLKARVSSNHGRLTPHFVRNAISSIGSLVSDNQLEGANTYLNALSDMMNGVMDDSMRLVIPLQKEINGLTAYLQLEQLRFGFDYRIFISDNLKADLIDIPPMLLQPSLENAVKHGVAGMGQLGLIVIRFLCSGKDMLVEIEDNGPGISQEQNMQKVNKGHGNGIRLTKERIGYLEKLQVSEGINYELIGVGTGIVARFRFIGWLD